MMFCENCGSKVPDDSKFCTECGATFSGATPAESVQSAVPARLPPQSAYAPPPPQRQAQPVYISPQPQYYNQAAGYGSVQSNRDPLTVGNYIGMFFLSVIPMVGFIMLLVWAFGSSVNLNKKNCARAMLILSVETYF